MLAPADKAVNNIIMVCNKYYLEVVEIKIRHCINNLK